MTLIKSLIREFTPPIIWRGLKRLKSIRARPEWAYVSDKWPLGPIDQRVKGWNVEDVLAAYKSKWPGFVASLRDARPFGVGAEAIMADQIDLTYHNSLMCFAYVLARAAHLKTSLSLLDWGGGIGHYFLLSQALMPQLKISFHCKDVPVLAEYGQSLFPEEHFYVDETCWERQYDLVMASGSLHYSPDWGACLRGLARSTAGYLFITRLPVVLEGAGFVYVQRPYRYGYNTEYMSWCLNRDEFVAQALGQGLRLVREFVTGEQPPIVGAPEQCQYRGYLFQPAAPPLAGTQ